MNTGDSYAATEANDTIVAGRPSAIDKGNGETIQLGPNRDREVQQLDERDRQIQQNNEAPAKKESPPAEGTSPNNTLPRIGPNGRPAWDLRNEPGFNPYKPIA